MTNLSPLREVFSQFVDFHDSDWDAGVGLATVHKFRAGEHIFRAGDITPDVNFLICGLGCHYYMKSDGARYNKAFLQTGDVASSMESLQLGVPARFSCEALEDTEVLTLSYANLAKVASIAPVWQQLRERLILRLALRKEIREADLLLQSPAERYLKFLQDEPRLCKRLPNYHIASYLGVSEVSLSRIRSRLGVQNSYNKKP